MHTKDDLKKLAVRIEDKSKRPVGSGVMWTPSATSNSVYIFTARHVIKGETEPFKSKDLIVRYLDRNDNELEIKVEEIGLHDTNNEIDVAILRCKASVGEFFMYDLKRTNNISSDLEVKIHGYPKVAYQRESFLLSRQSIDGLFKEYDDKIKKFQYSIIKPEIDDTDRNKELVNFSGSGVFVCENNTYKLIGIHSGGLGGNSDLRIINCAPIECIVDICRQNKWDVPKYVSDINGNLKDCLKLSYDEIQDSSFRNTMIEMIKEDYSEIIKSSFCGYSQKCKYGGDYHKCDSFRANLLVLITILKSIDEQIDLKSPYIDMSDIKKKSKIKFICSEGYDSCTTIKLENFIKSLKLDYSCRECIEMSSLVVWNSEKRTQRESICNKSKFDKIISDITDGLITENKYIDIYSGLPELKDITVIHIQELIDHVNNNGLDSLKKWISDQMK